MQADLGTCITFSPLEDSSGAGAKFRLDYGRVSLQGDSAGFMWDPSPTISP
jgi:hypothetical protein